jgi:uncharacterized membrane protein YhiD involved in acid resistance
VSYSDSQVNKQIGFIGAGIAQSVQRRAVGWTAGDGVWAGVRFFSFP